MNLPLAAFGGAGIGLLFGVIMGTSITPTVATMLGVLTTMLGGILGLNDTLFNNAKAARIGSFGVACVLGAYLGLFVRSHNLLAPSILDLKQGYIEVGFTEAQALNFIAIKEFGVSLSQLNDVTSINLPVGAVLQSEPESEAEGEVESEPQNASENALVKAPVEEPVAPPEAVASVIFKRHNNLLFGAAVEVSGCEELIHTDHTLVLDEVLNNFELTGGAWETLMLDVYDNLPEPEQKGVLLLVKDAVCAIKVKEINDCSAAKKVAIAGNDAWLDELSKLNPQWEMVADEIAFSELGNAQSLIAFNHIHSMLCRNNKEEPIQ
ncbi:hypothetical protein [Alteromonas sp. a30]|uniref:hypothetical protein n=1 Tax=Alteromonas sp. a30 TaxID=2730917 RepID=UPI00227E7DA7|nr:hypothetical protein [Alteromonas sp. a30]MCY7296507.1 hypothetical protein [Alteromonas sp. a30]